MITIEINEDDQTDEKKSYTVRITERLVEPVESGKPDTLHHVDRVTTIQVPDETAAKCWLIGWLSCRTG